MKKKLIENIVKDLFDPALAGRTRSKIYYLVEYRTRNKKLKPELESRLIVRLIVLFDLV